MGIEVYLAVRIRNSRNTWSIQMQRLLESIDRGVNSRGSVRLNKRVFGGSLRFGSHEDIEITTKAQENKTRWLLS